MMARSEGSWRRPGEPVDDLTIRAIIPVNLRPVRSIEEMDDSMGNRFGLDLPLNERPSGRDFEL